MARRRASDLAVGAMAALALIILALAVMTVGSESRLFVAKAYYRVVFPSAEGLVVGSPVKMSGVVVGTVSAIRLSRDPGRPGIEVEVGVDESFAARVREDSRAALRILQLLSGEKFVEIIAGSAQSPQLERGAEIPVDQGQQLFEQAAITAENLNDITLSLKSILGTLERGEGLLGKMLQDPQFGEEGLESLRGVVDNLRDLTGSLRRGEGLLGRLITDDSLATRVDELATSLRSVSEVLQAMQSDQGALGALLAEGGAGEQAIENLRDAAGGLKRVTERLESADGLLGRLLNDKAYSEQIAADLESITGNLAQITEKINRGEGTLGALVNDRTLHDGMEDVVAGLNDSKFARWLIRRYQKRGIKAGDAPAQQAAPGEAGP